MKRLYALTIALLLVFGSLASAEASTINLLVVPVPQYNQSHHFNVQINASGIIPPSDYSSYLAFALTGYVNQNPSGNFIGAGIYVNRDNDYGYIFVQPPLTPVCTAPSVPFFYGQGCLTPIPNNVQTHAMNQLIEWDYYPAPYNEWEAFARDNENAYIFLGKFTSTIDWFTGIEYSSALQYATPNNPQYAMYSLWSDPQGWLGGYGFLPMTQASVIISATNPNDTFVCQNGIYGIMRIGDLHTWYAGSAAGMSPLLTCGGWLWTS